MKFSNSLLIASCLGEKYGKNERSRFGPQIKETRRCDLDKSMAPVISTFSHISNIIGPKLAQELAMESDLYSLENVMVSPVTMVVQLGLLHEGADGQTKAEIEEALKLPESGIIEAIEYLSNRFQCIDNVTMRNALFLDSSFPATAYFARRVQSTKSNVFKVDFADSPELSRAIINQWSAGPGRLGSTLPEGSVDESTSMLFLSSMDFNSKWAVKFDERVTIAPFYLPDGSRTSVEMMQTQTALPFILNCNDYPNYQDCVNDDFVPTMITLPMEDPNIQLNIIVPNDQLPLHAIMTMSGMWLPYWRHLVDGKIDEILLNLPKVSTTTKTDLTKSYFDLGMTTISQPLIADFSRITDQQGLSVSTVFQENRLKWDIEGAFAGLQIGAVLKNGIAPSARGGRFSSLTEVTIDRPFVFAITDRATDTNLFLGIINNPKE